MLERRPALSSLICKSVGFKASSEVADPAQGPSDKSHEVNWDFMRWSQALGVGVLSSVNAKRRFSKSPETH
jgi:hypothetical protein